MCVHWSRASSVFMFTDWLWWCTYILIFIRLHHQFFVIHSNDQNRTFGRGQLEMHVESNMFCVLYENFAIFFLPFHLLQIVLSFQIQLYVILLLWLHYLSNWLCCDSIGCCVPCLHLLKLFMFSVAISLFGHELKTWDAAVTIKKMHSTHHQKANETKKKKKKKIKRSNERTKKRTNITKQNHYITWFGAPVHVLCIHFRLVAKRPKLCIW